MVRLTSDFWASAHLRQCRLDGVDAVLRRRGAAEAGAIFVSVDRLDGTADLYGPAPQSLLGGDETGRLFAQILAAQPVADVEARMAREVRFDPDLWWLTIDDRLGRPGIDLALPDSPGEGRT
jgi:hypothetical protein